MAHPASTRRVVVRPGQSTTVGHQAGASEQDAPRSSNWLAWLLRAALLAMLSYAVLKQDRAAIAAGVIGLGVSLAPQAVERLGRLRFPRPLEFVVVVGAAIEVASMTFGLYDRVWHWGKGVHAAELFLATLAIGWMMEGYRQHRPERKLDISVLLSATATLLAGFAVAVGWEVVEFYVDWVRQIDLQKSNTDTMTDFLWSNLATLFATMLAYRLYHHAFAERQRVEFGRTADWLTEGPGHILERHGVAVGVVLSVVIALLVLGLWNVDRGFPGLPTF